MSRFHSYIRTAQQMLAIYNGSLPFAHFAKAFFAKEKKYGSTDRKHISTLCYNHFRAAKALNNITDEEKFITATFLCETGFSLIIEAIKPEWNAIISLPAKEKIQLLGNDFREEKLFPFAQYVSSSIDRTAFALSFLIQPDLFLRIRPGNKNDVKNKLIQHSIPFEELNNECLSLVNGSKIEDVIKLNKEAVVQDYNSQQTGVVIKQYVLNHLPQINCWDCCAASGGKSLMLYDLQQSTNLTVSDVRESILHNLRQRFQQTGIQNYQSFVADASKPNVQLPGKKTFNLIIADVPCTGSGTWARTPEQCYFFKEEQIEMYAQRQVKIVTNVLPHLQPGGHFVYITCSVFTSENEDVVAHLQTTGLQLLHSQYLQGYQMKADTLFIAVLQKH
jgi:16S rRNA (cytosine967-C5)-methyltransferase